MDPIEQIEAGVDGLYENGWTKEEILERVTKIVEDSEPL